MGSIPVFGSHQNHSVMEAILKTNWGEHKAGDKVDLNAIQMEFALKRGLAEKAEQTPQNKAEQAPKNKRNGRV